MSVDTLGGRAHVRCDETSQATPHGRIVLFAGFPATASVFDRRFEGCPLRSSSPNALRMRGVSGTLLLRILAGSKCYAHIAGVRSDAVAATLTEVAAKARCLGCTCAVTQVLHP